MALQSTRFFTRGGMVIARRGYGDPGVLMQDLAVECRFRVDEICGRLELSERHFHRLFREAVGRAPKEWLRELRMVMARHHLREGGSVKEVATQLGYSHGAAFTRDFVECYGVAPTVFIRRSREMVPA